MSGGEGPQYDCQAQLQCSGYPGFPFWNARQCFTGIDPDSEPHDSAQCGSGCQPCFDYPGDLQGMYGFARYEGSRWLMPDVKGQNLDAHGRLHDLRTNEPWPVPTSIVYRRAPCYNNDGEECFGSLCSCQPTLTITPQPNNRCKHGETPGEPLIGYLTDFQMFMTSGWPMEERVNNIDCRHILYEQNPTRVFAGSDPLEGPIFMRDMGCASNRLIMCTGLIDTTSMCGSSYTNRTNDLQDTLYAQAESSTAWQAWNYMTVAVNSAGFAEPDPLRQPGEYAATRIRNAAMELLATVRLPANGNASATKFDNLDSDIAKFKTNAALGLWTRTYDGTAGPGAGLLSVEPGQLIFRRSGIAYPVRFCIGKVDFKVHLSVMSRYDRVPLAGGGHKFVEEYWPYARARIRIDLRVDTTAVRAVRREEPWRGAGSTTTVKLTDQFGCSGWPEVADDADDVVYLDQNGVPFSPPAQIEWRGWLGAFSKPDTRDIYNPDEQQYCGTQKCMRLIHWLSGPEFEQGAGTVIPAWSSHADSSKEEPWQMYLGALTINFKNDQYRSACRGG